MINIDEAIKKAKELKNISNGGSACFDFGDTVLVKYRLPTKYMENGIGARSCEEEVMEGVNLKAEKGVNIPRHIAIKRVIEDEDDVCYVLQEKSKGDNCASSNDYGVPIEQVFQELKKIYNIPFSQYKKLISDGCELYEMGYERQNKNLFYDKDTGFWFIDFLCYERDNFFEESDVKKMFEVLKFIIPRPIQIASSIKYDEKLTEEEQKKLDLLENFIETKTLLSIREVLPSFEKYEKFYLMDENSKFKSYLMQEGITKKDLFKLEEDDYKVYDELYETVVNNIIKKIMNDGKRFRDVKSNDIRNDSRLFGLLEAWKMHKDNFFKISNFEDKYNSEQFYIKKMLENIIYKLRQLEANDNINNFFNDMDEELREEKR